MSASQTDFGSCYRCALLSCALTFFGLHASAQDYGVVDTIRVSDQRQYVQAYHDTVMIFENSYVGGTNKGTGFTRFGNDAQWDSVTLYADFSNQPPMKGCVFAGRRGSNGDAPATYWILRDARTTRILPVERPGGQITVANFTRIRVHPANTKKIYAQQEYKVSNGYVTTTFVTNDDGENWKEIQTPVLPSDVARKQWLNFDYNFPNRVYISVDPSGRLNPDAYPRYYFTDDDGETFGIQYLGNDYVVGYGIWSKSGGVFGSKDVISIYTDSIGLPPDSAGTRHRIEPPWLQNVQKSLFPNYDSTKQKLGYAMSDYSDSDGTIEGLAFHPEGPLTFAVVYLIDTLVEGKWYNRAFVAATRDFGESWSLVVRPTNVLDGNSLQPTSLSIDPMNEAVYVSVLKRFDDPVTSKVTILGTYTIKSTPRTTSVAGESPELTNGSLHVYPNPASQGSDVTVAFSSAMSLGSDENVVVSCSTLDGRQAVTSYKQSRASKPQSTDCYTLSTSGLAPGVYIVQVQSRNRTASKLLVVTH
ncbi:MAG TPA: T9SS type A sorting domain-containing protein [Candidatus Didemnitutus sp.]|nr:T9SS type A sorting domain-containing protein [Candidatus Didemnitutus sp.]